MALDATRLAAFGGATKLTVRNYVVVLFANCLSLDSTVITACPTLVGV